MALRNQEKRGVVIFVGCAFSAFNAFMFVLWYFEPDPVNKAGIRYVHGLLDALIIAIGIVYVAAHVVFPEKNDEHEEFTD